jgi:hypothetical protein
MLFAAALAAQSRISTQGAHRMEVTLQRLESGQWKTIDPGLVLDKNDRVRFRFRANFAGFLYVTNRSTSDTTTLLFPRQDTGSDNRIAANKEYLVPATQGAFRVDGPPGYDVVAWTVSPVELGRPEPPPPPTEVPSSMKPRCDDTIFKARGACVDTAAGPQAKKDDGLVFIRDKSSSVISSNTPLKAPVVYEFHLAHQ